MTGSARTLVFTEQFYYPEGWGGAQLPRDITTYLASAGCPVEVICGSEQYAAIEGQAPPDPSTVGVRIRRIIRLFAGDIHRRKLLRQLWFCAAAVPLLLFRRRPRLFVTQTNPPFVVPLIAAIGGLCRRPFIIIAQDLYPEVLVAHGMVAEKSLFARLLRAVFGWAYGRAAAVVSLGPVMSEKLMQKGVGAKRIVTISNWATGDEGVVRGPENHLRRDWGLEGCFVILYSGNIGIAHDVETAILALREVLADLPATRLVFVGKGSRLAEAERMARNTGVSHAVQFRPLVPFELLGHSLGVADVALVTLRAGFEGLVVPSKLLGYMARGIPTLYIGPPSDAQQLIDASQGGACVANQDVEGLTAHLRQMAGAPGMLARMGHSAQAYYRDNLSRAIGLERYQTLIERIGNQV
jgi:colanic acid biosynthesis glycosyl transferase WcaI